VFEGRGFAERTLRNIRRAGRLDDRESALAREVALGTLRHLITLRHVLSHVARYNPRTVSPALKAILYSGAYQVIWMDRMPPFAAVHEAVSLTHRVVGARSAGMVNAVLRRLTEHIAQRRTTWQHYDASLVRVSWDSACAFALAVLPEASAQRDAWLRHIAAAAAERTPRLATLVSRFGKRSAERIAWASQATPALVVQRNALRIGVEALARRVRELFGDAASVTNDGIFLPSGAAVLDTSLFRDGLVYVQDSGARNAARCLEVQPGERVLDLCAAPGGKTAALAIDMRDRGEVVACDISANRLQLVDQNVTRLGITCVQSWLLPRDDWRRPSDLPEDSPLREPFDAVLVDVPCSNSGVIARRPEARFRLGRAYLQSLVPLQRRLLQQAAACVRPGGRLVYSTCSIEPAENEDIVADFVSIMSGWSVEHQQLTLPNWGPTPEEWRDGGFVARLRRGQ